MECITAARFVRHPCKPHGPGGKESADAGLRPELQKRVAVEIQSGEMRHGESCPLVDPNSLSQTGPCRIVCRDGFGSAIRGSASWIAT